MIRRAVRLQTAGRQGWDGIRPSYLPDSVAEKMDESQVPISQSRLAGLSSVASAAAGQVPVLSG